MRFSNTKVQAVYSQLLGETTNQSNPQEHTVRNVDIINIYIFPNGHKHNHGHGHLFLMDIMAVIVATVIAAEVEMICLNIWQS